MTKIEQITQLIEKLNTSISENTFVKISLANYKGAEENLKNIYAKRILIKNEEKLSFTYRFKTKDIVKNYSISEGTILIDKYLKEGFHAATLFTISFDLIYENFNDKKFVLRESPATNLQLPSLDHDREKTRKISSLNNDYLYHLNITDDSGKVLTKSQDKYKQINHYIEILSSLLNELPKTECLKIADMGSGKGYLTFALYDYLTNNLKLKTEMVGVEYRQELVELCNEIAAKSKFDKLSFVQGEIQNYECAKLDVMIALHACNTATDDAIAKAINAGAKLIVVAPCCQHQIREQIEKSNKENTLSSITKHGIFLERQSELITDGIRALIMEYFGYKTKVVEFISDAHTHKNVMIIGQKTTKKTKNPEILLKIQNLKDMFGIGEHYLEKALELVGKE